MEPTPAIVRETRRHRYQLTDDGAQSAQAPPRADDPAAPQGAPPASPAPAPPSPQPAAATTAPAAAAPIQPQAFFFQPTPRKIPRLEVLTFQDMIEFYVRLEDFTCEYPYCTIPPHRTLLGSAVRQPLLARHGLTSVTDLPEDNKRLRSMLIELVAPKTRGDRLRKLEELLFKPDRDLPADIVNQLATHYATFCSWSNCLGLPDGEGLRETFERSLKSAPRLRKAYRLEKSMTRDEGKDPETAHEAFAIALQVLRDMKITDLDRDDSEFRQDQDRPKSTSDRDQVTSPHRHLAFPSKPLTDDEKRHYERNRWCKRCRAHDHETGSAKCPLADVDDRDKIKPKTTENRAFRPGPHVRAIQLDDNTDDSSSDDDYY